MPSFHPIPACSDVPALQDFVEAGVFTGGTSIIMAKVLERYDPSWGGTGGSGTSGPGGSGTAHAGQRSGGSSGGGGAGPPDGWRPAGRMLWAADSFEGTPAPVEQDNGGAPGMRSG